VDRSDERVSWRLPFPPDRQVFGARWVGDHGQPLGRVESHDMCHGRPSESYSCCHSYGAIRSVGSRGCRFCYQLLKACNIEAKKKIASLTRRSPST